MSENTKEAVVSNASVAPENFDWDSIGKKTSAYSKDEHTRLEELYTKSLKTVNSHDLVDGIVVSISKKEVVVNIGFKSDGVIPVSEFRYNPELSTGDTVEVYIE